MLHKSAVFLLVPSILAGAILSCSSIANLPNPFASPTPTATATFTPTVTPSPTPTPTSTPTATPKPTGIVIDEATSGSRYTDYDAGFIMDISPDWVATKLDPQDMQAALSSMEKDNPAIVEAARNVLQTQSAGFRIFAFDKNPAHFGHGFAANFNVLISDEAMATKLPLEMLIEAAVDQYKTQVPGGKVKNLGIKTNAHGLDVGQVEIQLPMKLPNGTTLKVYEKQLVFQTKTALVIVTLAASPDKSSAVVAAFDPLIDQIQLIEK